MSATLALLSLLRIRAKNWGSPPGEPQIFLQLKGAYFSRGAASTVESVRPASTAGRVCLK